MAIKKEEMMSNIEKELKEVDNLGFTPGALKDFKDKRLNELGDRVDGVSKSGLKYLKTEEEEKTIKAIKELKKEIKSKKSYDKTLTKLLLHGLDAVSYDFDVSLTETFYRMSTATGSSVMGLYSTAQEVKDLRESAQKHHKKLDKKVEKLNSALSEYEAKAQTMVDAVVAGKSVEQVVAEAFGYQQEADFEQ